MSGFPCQPEDNLVEFVLEFYSCSSQFARLIQRKPQRTGRGRDLQVGTRSHGHLAQSPSHRKEANKFLPAVYLDSAANYQIFTHFIIRVQQEHLTGKLCNTKGL